MKPLLARIDGLQRRQSALGFPLAVFKRFGEHRGSQLSATVSYYSFFSVFPLLLAFVTVLGLVLEDRPDLRDDLIDSAIGQIPVIGSQIADSSSPLTGNPVVLILGLAGAVWAGLGAVTALQLALDEIRDVPQHERPKAVGKKLKALAFLVVFAVGISASTAAASVTELVDLDRLATVGAVVGSVVVNVGILLGMFLLLPTGRRPLRALLPGAIVGGVLIGVLLHFGRLVFTALQGASDTYGTFAIVIGLLGWFHLVSRVVLLAAMLNEVLARRLWPRSLTATGELTDADRKTSLLDMQRVQRDTRFGFALAVGSDVVGTDETAADQVSTVR